MFYSLPDIESQSSQKVGNNKKHKKSKRHSRRYTKRHHVKNSKFSSVMSAWAENFTVAATWQLKHQLAYWKARAVSLEYENSVLHEVIRRNHLVVPSTSGGEPEFETGVGFRNNPAKDDTKHLETEDYEENDTDYSENEADSDRNDDEGEDFEVSEEFIQFLTANAKYKEDAKRERERLKAKEEQTHQNIPEPPESIEQKINHKKELYGDKWQTIVALEMSLMSDFINESDKRKPMYWPNIPFNFKSS